MAPYFETLPTEILRTIVSRAPSSSSLALMQTCSAIHRRIEPLLYEHIEWNIERTYKKPTVHQFLEKLLARPEVAQWVRSFTMVGRINQKIYSGLTREMVKRLLVNASSAHPDLFDGYETEEWWYLIYSSSTIMLVSLLLLLCPNITHLTPWSGYAETPHRLLFLSRAIKTLPNLQFIDYATGNTKFPSIPWTDSSTSFLFQIPSVRHLRIQVTEDVGPGLDTIPYADFPVSPHITKLDLHSSVLSERSIGKIVSKLPHLRALKLGLLRETKPGSPDSVAAGSFIDCEALGNALLPVEATLESLTIKIEFYSTREWHRTNGGPYSSGRDGNPGKLHFWGTKGALNSLRPFLKLRYLEADLSLLIGFKSTPALDLREVLPRNLKMLKLRSDFIACREYWRTTEHVVELIDELLVKNPWGLEAVVLEDESRATSYTYTSGS